MTTPRERALEHTVMALYDVVIGMPGIGSEVHELLKGLRGRMNADTEPAFLASMARQLSATAQLMADRNVDLPDEFCRERQRAVEQLKW